jgi:hypothetical protein
MVLDHIANVYSEYYYFKYIGRVVYPVFAFIMIYNYINNTSNKENYIKRVLIWALISQPIYYYAFYDYFGQFELNILFTMFFGLLLIYFIEKKQHLILFIYMLIITPISMFTSYSILGILLLPAIYFSFTNKYILFGLLYILLFLNGIDYAIYTLLCIPIVYIIANIKFNIKRTKGLYFYIFYPLHILIIKLSKVIF